MIEFQIASDLDRDQLYVGLLWGGKEFAEVWYDPGREAYVALFYDNNDFENPLDLTEVQRALVEARRLLVERGFPPLPWAGGNAV